MIKDLVIRSASELDLEALCQFSAKTFWDAYASQNRLESMHAYIEKNFNKTTLSQELNDTRSSFFIAEFQNQFCAYMKLNQNKMQNGIIAEKPIELERIYVDKDSQGFGVGKKMMDEAIKIAKQLGHDKLWLGVWEENHKAIAFYEKYGFSPSGSHIFMFADEPQIDILFAISV